MCFLCMPYYSTDRTKDFLDLLNFPESPDHTVSTPLHAEQISAENSTTHPAPFPLADMRCFQKDILKLMVEGLKIGLVSRTCHTDTYNITYPISLIAHTIRSLYTLVGTLVSNHVTSAQCIKSSRFRSRASVTVFLRQ